MALSVQYPNYWSYGNNYGTDVKRNDNDSEHGITEEELPQKKPFAEKKSPHQREVPVEKTFDREQPSQGLASIQDQHYKQQIKLDSILDDFRSTMAALGVTDEERSFSLFHVRTFW